MSMYLKKPEKEKYLKEIEAYESQKVLGMKDANRYKYAKYFLGVDYYSRLRRDLEHISNVLTLDSLAIITGDSEEFLKYIKYMESKTLKELRRYILNARDSLDYMQTHIEQEIIERNPPKDKKISDFKR